SGQVDWVARVCEHCLKSNYAPGTVAQALAQNHPLPDDGADSVFTDPPYYDAFAYSHLADFFYFWLRRATPPDAMNTIADETPKDREIVVYGPGSPGDRALQDTDFFHREMTLALAESRRVAKPPSLNAFVFANKTTSGWESFLRSVVDAGWVVTASWPIDTERPNRQRALGSAALGSSVHLVCRPRENPDGSLRAEVGEWREVLGELPQRIHAWMPRLAEEGIVGADSIFACLGPGLEIFSRYSRVEKASGEVVTLGEYLEQVWVAVSKEALSLLF
ncbi:unnamed protein product, partial [marine sediment metagenome]